MLNPISLQLRVGVDSPTGPWRDATQRVPEGRTESFAKRRLLAEGVIALSVAGNAFPVFVYAEG